MSTKYPSFQRRSQLIQVNQKNFCISRTHNKRKIWQSILQRMHVYYRNDTGFMIRGFMIHLGLEEERGMSPREVLTFQLN